MQFALKTMVLKVLEGVILNFILGLLIEMSF